MCVPPGEGQPFVFQAPGGGGAEEVAGCEQSTVRSGAPSTRRWSAAADGAWATCSAQAGLPGGSYDDRMTSTMQPSNRRPAGRGFVLLVLAVLAGVLAMHGLGSGPAPAKASAVVGGHVMTVGHDEAAQQVAGPCSHTDGGMGHADHADATCAAAGVAAPYAPHALVAALAAAPVPVALPGSAAGMPESGRALPDLAELQLLRI